MYTWHVTEFSATDIVAVSAYSLIPGVIWQISTYTPNLTGSSSLTLNLAYYWIEDTKNAGTKK